MSHFVHNSSNVRFKGHDRNGETIANVQCSLLALRHALKPSCQWNKSLDQCSSAGCWSRFIQMLLQIIDVPRWFLINMFLHVSVAKCWCTSVIFMQPGVKDAYYCDVLLLEQLLSDICQAAGDFCFPAHHMCTRALSCCDTRRQTSHQTWPPNRPDLSSVD